MCTVFIQQLPFDAVATMLETISANPVELYTNYYLTFKSDPGETGCLLSYTAILNIILLIYIWGQSQLFYQKIIDLW